MPWHKNYDKLMNSKNADVQILIIGGAGSTTAAHFTKIYNKKTLGSLRYSWYGVFKIWRSIKLEERLVLSGLLNQLIEEN